MSPVEGLLPRARHGDDLVIEELPDEVLVYDRQRKQAHCLSRAAALVWRSCDGKTSVGEVLSLLEQAGFPRDPAIVDLALDRLAGAHLLEEPLSAESVRFRSRRTALKQLGWIAGAIAVSSIMAPAAAACVSPGVCANTGGGGESCCGSAHRCCTGPVHGGSCTPC